MPERRTIVPGVREESCVAELAARRNRLVTNRQLQEIGISTSAISRWVSRGRLRRVHHGVYLYGGGELSADGVFEAAAMAIGDDAVVGYFAAAALQEFWKGPTTPVDIIVPRRICSRDGIRVHAGCELPMSATTLVRGIRVTTPEHTVLDLATAARDDRVFRRLVHEAQVQKRTSVQRLRAEIARFPDHRGVPRLGAELAYGPTPTRSGGEDDLVQLLRGGDVPPFETNAHPDGAPAGVEVDVLFRQQKVVVEYDGGPWHKTAQRRRLDAEKTEMLEGLDYIVIRLTDEDMKPENRARTLMRIRRALGLT
jgi:hypothetical protein